MILSHSTLSTFDSRYISINGATVNSTVAIIAQEISTAIAYHMQTDDVSHIPTYDLEVPQDDWHLFDSLQLLDLIFSYCCCFVTCSVCCVPFACNICLHPSLPVGS